jgi:predicted alpha/beta hydrolase family esterase
MQQILFLHGGDSFLSYDTYLDSLINRELDYDRLKYSPKWREWIAQELSSDDILLPTFPNGYNAQFNEWKIYFEKILPFLHDDFTIVGHSLGAMFLAKYFEEAHFPIRARRIVLIAGRYGGDDEDTGSFKVMSSKKLPYNTHEVHLFHSEDDPIVNYEDMAKFKSDMPHAIIHSFTDRAHFNDPTFPELLELLKQK